jgi:molybdate transport system substrate-binding protein
MANPACKYILLLSFICPGTSVAQDIPVIAVASNLSLPMTVIAEKFETVTGIPVRLTIGSSGNLASQIVQGAPYELYITANKKYIDLLIDREVHVIQYKPYLIGEIGMFIPNESQLFEKTSIDSVINALMFSNYRKIAIANPEHAPYGIAAIEVLHNAGIWALESIRVILADSVSLVIPYALSGNVDMAIIPYSFMLQDDMNQKGKYLAIPESYHTPLIQYLVELNNKNTYTQAFKYFLDNEISRDILKKYGYKVLQ